MKLHLRWMMRRIFSLFSSFFQSKFRKTSVIVSRGLLGCIGVSSMYLMCYAFFLSPSLYFMRRRAVIVYSSSPPPASAKSS